MIFIVGIDPGPVVGFSRLWLGGPGGHELAGSEAAQVTPGLLIEMLESLHAFRTIEAVAVERFLVGSRASRSATSAAGATARDVVARVRDWATRSRVVYIERNAGTVKPWATDTRLERAGLLEATEGMRHARDAARHALYTAVDRYGLPDPLSNAWRSP